MLNKEFKDLVEVWKKICAKTSNTVQGANSGFLPPDQYFFDLFSQINVTTVREYLPEGDFSIMTEMLKKFLSFMNLTVSSFCCNFCGHKYDALMTVEMKILCGPRD